MRAQQLYAVIKARSKYAHQQPREFGPGLPKRGMARPFPVVMVRDSLGYCVAGNDNRYRIEDVNFFVLIDEPIKFPFVGLS